MDLITQLLKKYKVIGNDLANKLHNYPDDVWDLLSRWYYHRSLQIGFENIDADEIDEGELREMKQHFQTQDGEKALVKCHDYHDSQATKLENEIDKKYPELGDDLHSVVLGSNLADKFDKWMGSVKVVNIVGEPRIKYLDY